jgi:hypothetical protein
MPFDPTATFEVEEAVKASGFDPFAAFEIEEAPASSSLRTAIPEPGEVPLFRGVKEQRPPQAFPALESRAEANIAAKTPELTGEEAEAMLLTPQVHLPNPVPESMPITRGVVNVAKSVPEFLTAPGAGPIGVAQLIPGVREVVDTVMGAGMVKAGAQMAGEASVTGDRQQMTEGVLGGVLGAAAIAAPHVAPMIADRVAASRVGRPDLAAVDIATAARMQPRPVTGEPIKLSPEQAALLPKTAAVVEQTGERTPSASKVEEAAEVHGNVPVEAPKGESAQALPIGEGQPGVRPQEAVAEPASVPLIITKEMDQALADLGYSQKARNAMRPEEAREILRTQSSPPSSGGKEVPVAAPETPVAPSAPVEAGGAPKIEGMGGAVPEEFAPTSQTATGIKNATVDRERAARGLPPAIQPARRSFGTVWDEAMARIDREGPGVQDALIKSLKEKPRALTDLEDAMLLHRQIDLQNEYGKATRDLAQAYDDGRLADAEIQKARAGELSDKLLELYNVGKAAGTETGRGLAARKMMANEDFTLAKMETEVRSAKGGKPLSDTERAQLTQTASEFERINKELEAKVAERDKLLSEAQMARTMAEMQAAAAKEASRIPPAIQRIIDRVRTEIKKGADESRKFLAGAQFTLSPEVLYHLSRIGADNLLEIGEAGARWTAKMIADIGERVRPYLDEVLAASQKLVDDTTDRLSGKVEATVRQAAKQAMKETPTAQNKAEQATDKLRERIAAGDAAIAPLVRKLARAFVETGIKEREPLITAVHDVVSGMLPDWTRRQTMDAISGYGEMKPLTKDEVSVRLRDLKGQMQQIAKLEDMAAKEAPKKTGIERRIPSDIEKELIKQVNEAKKKGGYEVTDPEKQLRTALDETKARMRTEIKDLERRIKEKDFSKKPRRAVELDNEAITLEHQREKIKQDYHRMVMEKRLSEQTVPQRIWRHGQEVANLWRAIRTSIDFSAVLRQGKFMLTHPVRAARALPDMFRAFASDKEAFRIDKELKERANYKSGLYERSGLYLADRGVPLSKMEEAYMSRLVDDPLPESFKKRFPKAAERINKYNVVAGSGRAYSAYLNRLRADSFDSMVASLGRNGTVTAPEAQTLANFINVATGRGNLGMANRAAVGLNTWFFAPRYVASRFQMLLGQPLYHGVLSGEKGFLKGATRARKMIAVEYAKLLGGYATIYTLASLAGAKVGTDPYSSDFGKFVIGDTRVDPLAGLSQATVFLSRVIGGKKTTLGGKTRDLRGDKVPYGGGSVQDVVANFLRTKLAPLPGTALDFAVGKDVTGQPIPTDPAELLLRYVGPISMQDVLDTMKEQGIPAGIALQILNMFGESVQTYEDRPKK